MHTTRAPLMLLLLLQACTTSADRADATDRSWVDAALYPFASRWAEVDGGRMHYVDEGEGEPIVFVHGTPTWSFLYRDLIARLSKTHRCVAVDHIGFGLSDKPEAWAYTPEAHAANVERLIERLGLKDVTLVVHDFGGPIGLSYAIRHPENVRRIVAFNTFLWSLEGDEAIADASSFVEGWLGRFLYKSLNFSPRWLVPEVVGEGFELDERIHDHYVEAFPDSDLREGPWRMGVELVGSSGFFERLWSERARLRDIPALIVWGKQDPTFGPRYLERLRGALPHAEVVELEGVGHFPQEEAAPEVRAAVARFLESR